jgi:hypothetical protein
MWRLLQALARSTHGRAELTPEDLVIPAGFTRRLSGWTGPVSQLTLARIPTPLTQRHRRVTRKARATIIKRIANNISHRSKLSERTAFGLSAPI